MARSFPLALVAMSFALQACNSPFSESKVEMPFDPTGRWSGTAEGLLKDSTYVGPLTVDLEIFGEPFRVPHSEELPVELTGRWTWGDLAGDLNGFWNAGPKTDDAARDSGNCPEFYTVCSLNLSLDPPVPDVCGEQGGLGGLAPLWIQGWFEGPNTIVAAELYGIFSEGRPGEGNTWTSCQGTVLISLSTTARLQRG